MFVGGIRALLLQSLHPLAMAGVAAHSGYKGDPWGRLQRTSTFLATTTFGTIEDAEALIEPGPLDPRTGRGHGAGRPVVCRVRPPSAALGARDRGGQLPRAHQRYGAQPLSEVEADTYVAQASIVATRLGVIDPPLTVAELAAELDGIPAGAEGHRPGARRRPGSCC